MIALRAYLSLTQEDGSYYNQSQEYQDNLINHFKSSEEFLKKEVLHDFDFIKIYKGWIPKKDLRKYKKKKFSFIHIDLDLHKPILDTLEFFYPRLVKGGIIICDDYNSSQFPGAKKAWDDFLKTKKVNSFMNNLLEVAF